MAYGNHLGQTWDEVVLRLGRFSTGQCYLVTGREIVAHMTGKMVAEVLKREWCCSKWVLEEVCLHNHQARAVDFAMVPGSWSVAHSTFVAVDAVVPVLGGDAADHRSTPCLLGMVVS